MIRKHSLIIGFTMMLTLLIAGQVAAAEIAVIRSTITEAATANYPTYVADLDALTEWMEQRFEFDVVTDAEVLNGALSDYQLAILPNNGVMSSADVEVIRAFADSGGKLLGFYSTSLRDAGLALVGYQVGDVFGLSWSRFTTDPEFDVIQVVSGHPALANAPSAISIASRSTQEVQVTTGQVLAVRASDDGVASANPVIVASDNGIFITTHMASGPNLALDDVQQLLDSIISYYAPDAVRE